jgi:hypothetical protein
LSPDTDGSPAYTAAVPFSEIVGHPLVVAQLEASLADGRLPHALLLAGPEGVGKTTLAEALATVVLDTAGWPGGLAAHPDHWLGTPTPSGSASTGFAPAGEPPRPDPASRTSSPCAATPVAAGSR